MSGEENMQNEPLVLTVQQVAGLLQKKERTIREMCYRGLIPHYKVGRSRRFIKEEIVDWLKDKCRVEINGNHGQDNENDES